MKYAAALALASAAAVSADCSVTSFEEGGNWYCQAVTHIKYQGLDIPGSYSAVSNMDSAGGCSYTTQAYSGSIAPFDEELSVHFRGPIQLKTFAVYTPTTTTKKRSVPKTHKRHGHQHLHKKHHEQHEEEKRALGDEVVATINGQVVSWKNNWSGENTAVAAAAAATTPAAVAATYVKSTKTATAAGSSATSESYVSPGDYERVGYYNAESQEADGIAFMGNYGGQGSGVFDTVWGNSLSYLNSAGTGGAASPSVLSNVLVGDNEEFAIFADTECTSSADCGYYRPGSVAHHGFGGSDKVFLFEFKMPLSGNTGFNGDMPAVWLLNSKIPRTQQYGDCSCWKGGCGEADVFEVLTSGSTKAKSTFHFAQSIGSSDYFSRPTSEYIKVAVVFQASTSTASIKLIDSATNFSSGLTGDLVSTFVDDIDELGLFTSLLFPSKN